MLGGLSWGPYRVCLLGKANHSECAEKCGLSSLARHTAETDLEDLEEGLKAAGKGWVHELWFRSEGLFQQMAE